MCGVAHGVCLYGVNVHYIVQWCVCLEMCVFGVCVCTCLWCVLCFVSMLDHSKPQHL